MSKKKIVLKAAPGQAAFVADLHVLEHIRETYIYMSESCDDKNEAASWMQVAQDIDEWIKKTYVPEDEEYEEEW